MTSVAVVVLDTVRKDLFDEYFDWLPGLRYESAYSTSNWTGPAHASLFTGKYGSTIGVSSKSIGLDCDQLVLAESLSEQGFRTRGWSANVNVSQSNFFDRGFDEFSGPIDLKTGDRNIFDIDEFLSRHEGLSKKKKYARAIREAVFGDCDTFASLWYGFKQARGKDWSQIPDDGASVVRQRTGEMSVETDEFLFVNLIEAHVPYYPPAEFRNFDEPVKMPFGEAYFGVEDPELTRRAYRSCVRYLGEIYRDIFNNLSEKFDYVITLSDHGELLGEHHNMWNHVSGVYPELTHIPLVISGDGLTGETDTPVSILDLYATILHLAGVDGVPSDSRVIVPPPTESRPYLAEYRGPFERSIERAAEYDFDIEQYNRDLFALIEPGYYGYEDYDGWKERGEPPRGDPRSTVRDLVSEYDMGSLSSEEIELNGSTETRLKELGYL